MGRRRACGALVALAVVLACASAVTARAATDPYAGSHFYAPYDGSSTVAYPDGEVSGEFRYQPYAPPDTTTTTEPPTGREPTGGFIDRIVVSVSLDDPSQHPGCPDGSRTSDTQVRPDGTPSPSGEPQVVAFSVPGDFVCNGTYTATALAQVEQAGQNPPPKKITTRFDVAAPPPPVTGVTATANPDRRVVVTWDAITDPPPDFVGYVVQRKVGSGSYARIANMKDVAPVTDSRVPPEGGDLSYRVLAVRSAPAGFVTSSVDTSTPATITIDAAPTTPSTGGATGTAPRRAATPRRAVAPRTPTTVDTGFDQNLPYDPNRPSAQTTQPPADDLASVLYDDSGGSQPKGLLVPSAIALVMLAWAMHLRYLAHRAAQPY